MLATIMNCLTAGHIKIVVKNNCPVHRNSPTDMTNPKIKLVKTSIYGLSTEARNFMHI